MEWRGSCYKQPGRNNIPGDMKVTGISFDQVLRCTGAAPHAVTHFL